MCVNWIVFWMTESRSWSARTRWCEMIFSVSRQRTQPWWKPCGCHWRVTRTPSTQRGRNINSQSKGCQFNLYLMLTYLNYTKIMEKAIVLLKEMHSCVSFFFFLHCTTLVDKTVTIWSFVSLSSFIFYWAILVDRSLSILFKD